MDGRMGVKTDAGCETIKQIQELKSPSTDKDEEKIQLDSLLQLICIYFILHISLQLVDFT